MEYKILLLAFKAQHGLCPAYLAALIKPYLSAHNLQDLDMFILIEPLTSLTTRGDRAFEASVLRLWNTLPPVY
jgi:hypothetical protein